MVPPEGMILQVLTVRFDVQYIGHLELKFFSPGFYQDGLTGKRWTFLSLVTDRKVFFNVLESQLKPALTDWLDQAIEHLIFYLTYLATRVPGKKHQKHIPVRFFNPGEFLNVVLIHINEQHVYLDIPEH